MRPARPMAESATGSLPPDASWSRRARRVAGHGLLVGLMLLLLLGAPPGQLLDAGGEPVAVVRQVTSLGSPWAIFSPNVRDHARWTEVIVDPGGPDEQRWRVEDERRAALGLQGVRYRKLAETLRRSCVAATGYAQWAMAEHDASRVSLYTVVDHPRQDVERGRSLLVRADRVDGEVRVVTEGCGT